jgi:hypothetical protein
MANDFVTDFANSIAYETRENHGEVPQFFVSLHTFHEHIFLACHQAHTLPGAGSRRTK